jgi:hypothetical protein
MIGVRGHGHPGRAQPVEGLAQTPSRPGRGQLRPHPLRQLSARHRAPALAGQHQGEREQAVGVGREGDRRAGGRASP